MKYVLYYRYRLGEGDASEAAMDQQREAVDLLKSGGHAIEAEYIEYETAPPGQPELDPRPKLRMAFEHVVQLRQRGCDAELAILRVCAIGTGDPFEWVDESTRSPEQPIIVVDELNARGEAGELLRKYRGIIDPQWGFEIWLDDLRAEFLRRQRERNTPRDVD